MKYDYIVDTNPNAKKPVDLSKINLSEMMQQIIEDAQKGDASAQFIVGMYYDTNENFNEALYCYRQAAYQRYPMAEFFLGDLYFNEFNDDNGDGELACKKEMAFAFDDDLAAACGYMAQHYDPELDDTSLKQFKQRSLHISTFWYGMGAYLGRYICMYNYAISLLHFFGIDFYSCDKLISTAKYFLHESCNHYDYAKDFLNSNPNLKIKSDDEFTRLERDLILQKDRITFGKYYDKDKNSMVPLRWIVCDHNAKDDSLTLICERSVRTMIFSKNQNCPWDGSDIRNFLNGEFYEKAFTEAEKDMILSQDDDFADPNPVYNCKYGEKRLDDVTIPSITDVLILLSKNNWKCHSSEYDRVVIFVNDNNYGDWWLRNEGETDSDRCFMTSKGKFYFDGRHCRGYAGVRPMIKIKCDENFISHIKD